MLFHLEFRAATAMTPQVKRTYSARVARPSLPSSPPSELSSPPTRKRKRPLVDHTSLQNSPPTKKQNVGKKPLLKPATKSQKAKGKQKSEQKPLKLTQLHFSLDVTVLRTCPLCELSYTKGAPDDESLHRKHCARVQKGLEWGREEEKEMLKAHVEELATGVKLKNGVKGRIICFRPDVGGKIGVKVSIALTCMRTCTHYQYHITKLATLLETISLALSSPPLSAAVLQHCKIYLFLLSSSSTATATSREKIVGCLIAQRITTAMAIASDTEITAHTLPQSTSVDGGLTPARPPVRSFIPVDTSTNLYVHPARLPTPMGVPRLFVSSSHRRLGIASHLLTTAAATFILGCPLDPIRGEIAFTQPTGAGKGILEAWGKGGVRIYEEEQHL